MFDSYYARVKWENGKRVRSELDAAENTSSPDTRIPSMPTNHTRFALGGVFCVKPDVQVVDTHVNRPLGNPLSMAREMWQMATAGDQENACKDVRALQGGRISRRVFTAYTDAPSSIGDALEFVRCRITPPTAGSRDQELASVGKLHAHPIIHGITRDRHRPRE